MADSTFQRVNCAKMFLLAGAAVAALAVPFMIAVGSAPAIRAQALTPMAAPVQATTTQQGTAIPPSTEKPVAFDVASIKPNNTVSGEGRSEPVGGTVRITPGMVVGRRATARRIIQVAYRLTDYQVSGGPAWLDSETFDLDAKAETADKNQLRQMLQTLLSERFKLVVHRGTREMSVYAMTVGKKGPGPNLHELKEAQAAPPMSEAKPEFGNSRVGLGGPTVIFTGGTMQDLAIALSGPTYNLGRPVVDKTGLQGMYYGYLHWVDDNDVVPALQEELGLKLESQKAAVEILVIDSIAKPDPN
jgi:uncharacterized protein (TIGR03435 family)